MSKKTGKIRYMYTLVSQPDSGIDRNVGDYVMAANAQEAYEIAVSVCGGLNEKYGMDYSVQSVMPN